MICYFEMVVMFEHASACSASKIDTNFSPYSHAA